MMMMKCGIIKCYLYTTAGWYIHLLLVDMFSCYSGRRNSVPNTKTSRFKSGYWHHSVVQTTTRHSVEHFASNHLRPYPSRPTWWHRKLDLYLPPAGRRGAPISESYIGGAWSEIAVH